jgi:hypothetical protein
VRAQDAATASVGDAIVIDGVRVTLLDFRTLTAEAYRTSGGNTPDLWPGGGFHFAFLVENRPGQAIAPVLGEVRVVLDSQQYNQVTNATSVKPLAPYIIVWDVGDFFDRPYGRTIRYRPRPRPDTIAGIVEVFLRGGAVPAGATGTVELEQGGTYMSEGASTGLRAADVRYSWFRFRLPRID